MSRVPWTAAALALLLAALVLPAAQPERKRTEAEAKAELQALTERLERIQRQTRNDAAEETRLARALRDAERAVSRTSGDLAALRAQRAQRGQARQQLVDERARRQAERDATEADLASQLRAAYFMGRSEPLKLLLNQRNPAEFGRNLTYYGYLGRLRASQIHLIAENIARIDELTLQIDEEDAKLADLEVQQKQRLGEREAAVRQRGQVLASLQKDARSRAEEAARLQAQRRQMEDLVRELGRAAESAPYYPDTPFARLRGKLSWPVAGRLVANRGATQVAGIDIDAAAGTEVRAVHEGRVLFADYRSGRGNLIILDHGGGYLTVYGHNENLFKAAGAKVAAGEKIATVGDTGGRRQPGLYFEIRYAASKSAEHKPVDPRPWFRSRTPPGG